MASGSVGVSTSNQYISGVINWSSTPNTAGNYSDVYCEFRAWRTNTGYTTSGTCWWRINAWAGSYSSISATTNNGSTAVSLTYNSNTFIGSWSFRVYHNADGTASIGLGISSDTGISGTSWTSSAGSGTCYMDTIPRASQPSWNDGSNQKTLTSQYQINMNRASTSFTHTVRWGYGSQTGTIATGVTDSCLWTLDATMAQMTPASTQGYGEVYVDTYNGGTLIGTKSVGFYGNVPNNSTFQPAVGGVTPSETVSGVTALALGAGKYVQGLSNVSFSITGIGSQQGATVSTVNITFNGTAYTASVSSGTATWTTGVLSTSGTLNYSITCTDSRGYTDQSPITGSITVLPYATPLISTYTAKRCDVNGNINELGTYLRVVRNGSASSLKDGSAVEKNTLGCSVQWSIKGANSWTAMSEMGVSASATLSISTAGITSTKTDFSITNAYDVKFTLTDKFNNTVSTATVSVGSVMMSWGKTGVGIGKAISNSSTNALEVYGNILMDGGAGVTRSIMSSYSNSMILSDHANGNVTLSATGGMLYLGYVNTTKNLLIADLYTNDGLTKIWGKDGTATASGTNANGTYVRYADGTQICYLFIPGTTLTCSTIALAGGTYYYSGRTWTFPASFVGTPSCVNSGDIGTAGPEVHQCFNPTTTQVTFEDGIFGTNASLSCNNSLIAIGRWK